MFNWCTMYHIVSGWCLLRFGMHRSYAVISYQANTFSIFQVQLQLQLFHLWHGNFTLAQHQLLSKNSMQVELSRFKYSRQSRIYLKESSLKWRKLWILTLSAPCFEILCPYGGGWYFSLPYTLSLSLFFFFFHFKCLSSSSSSSFNCREREVSGLNCPLKMQISSCLLWRYLSYSFLFQIWDSVRCAHAINQVIWRFSSSPCIRRSCQF